MDPSFTESTTHPRKGKWTKPRKPSRHDKRSPRRDPVAEVSGEEHVESAAAAAPVPTVPAKPVCEGPVPSLAAIYKEDGYQGYIDYLHADQCSCKDCAKQIALNQKWMATNEAALEEAEGVYLAWKEREQEEREWRDWEWRERHY